MKQKQIFSLAICCLMCSISYYSCVKEKGQMPAKKSSCDSLNVKWSTFVQPLIQTNCLNPGCHDPASGANYTSGIDLTSYALVKAKVDAGKIRARVIDANPSWMPQGGPLPSSDREKIDCWLQNGALEN